jgi:hypothetical protein
MNRGRRGASGFRARGWADEGKRAGAGRAGDFRWGSSESPVGLRRRSGGSGGGGRITESQALEQGPEALARGDDGHDVPAAAAPGADKHIDGKLPPIQG